MADDDYKLMTTEDTALVDSRVKNVALSVASNVTSALRKKNTDMSSDGENHIDVSVHPEERLSRRQQLQREPSISLLPGMRIQSLLNR
jgi:hypothetical protein